MMTERPHLPACRRSERAYTVLEMLVVIAIIGALLMIGLISLRQQQPKITLRNTAMEVSVFLQQARLQAIRGGAFTVVTVETEPAGVTDPDDVENQWLVTNIVGLDGAVEERNTYQLPSGYPPIFIWGHGENEVNGTTGNTFDGERVIFTPAGQVQDTGALRLSYPKNGQRNIIEVAVLTQSGLPVMRKFLLQEDRPEESQLYYQETLGEATKRNLWVWY